MKLTDTKIGLSNAVKNRGCVFLILFGKKKERYYFNYRDAMDDLFAKKSDGPPRLRNPINMDSTSILFLSPQITSQLTRYRYNLNFPVAKENYNLGLNSYVLDAFKESNINATMVGYERKSNLTTKNYNLIYKLRTTMYELSELPSDKLVPFSYAVCEEIKATEGKKYFYSSYIVSYRIQPKLAPMKLYAGVVTLPFTMITGKDLSSLISATSFYTNTFSFLVDLENVELKYVSYYNTGQKVTYEKLYSTAMFLANDLKYYLHTDKNEE